MSFELHLKVGLCGLIKTRVLILTVFNNLLKAKKKKSYDCFIYCIHACMSACPKSCLNLIQNTCEI